MDEALLEGVRAEEEVHQRSAEGRALSIGRDQLDVTDPSLFTLTSPLDPNKLGVYCRRPETHR